MTPQPGTRPGGLVGGDRFPLLLPDHQIKTGRRAALGPVKQGLPAGLDSWVDLDLLHLCSLPFSNMNLK